MGLTHSLEVSAAMCLRCQILDLNNTECALYRSVNAVCKACIENARIILARLISTHQKVNVDACVIAVGIAVLQRIK